MLRNFFSLEIGFHQAKPCFARVFFMRNARLKHCVTIKTKSNCNVQNQIIAITFQKRKKTFYYRNKFNSFRQPSKIFSKTLKLTPCIPSWVNLVLLVNAWKYLLQLFSIVYSETSENITSAEITPCALTASLSVISSSWISRAKPFWTLTLCLIFSFSPLITAYISFSPSITATGIAQLSLEKVSHDNYCHQNSCHRDKVVINLLPF